MFDEHKEIYLFSQTSVRIQLHDTKGVENFASIRYKASRPINLFT